MVTSHQREVGPPGFRQGSEVVWLPYQGHLAIVSKQTDGKGGTGEQLGRLWQ